MAKEDNKDFEVMLHDNKDMPKVQIVTDTKTIAMYGGEKMYFAPPIEIREYFADLNGADFTEPMTAGIFVSIAAWASHKRIDDKTPYWRTLKADGELNVKFPGGAEAQKAMLEAEGHTIIEKGRKNIRYFVKDYEKVLFELKAEKKFQ